MDKCSPSKRRALAPLNANALGSPTKLFKNANALGHSPVKMAIEGRKRLLELEGAASPAGKKACLERDEVCRSPALHQLSSICLAEHILHTAGSPCKLISVLADHVSLTLYRTRQREATALTQAPCSTRPPTMPHGPLPRPSPTR